MLVSIEDKIIAVIASELAKGRLLNNIIIDEELFSEYSEELNSIEVYINRSDDIILELWLKEGDGRIMLYIIKDSVIARREYK